MAHQDRPNSLALIIVDNDECDFSPVRLDDDIAAAAHDAVVHPLRFVR